MRFIQKACLSLAVLLMLCVLAQSQSAPRFTTMLSQTFPNFGGGAVEWGDFDNDGDLDVLLSGYIDGQTASSGTFIFENKGGRFVKSPIVLPRYRSSYAQWADIDNDGFLDLAIGGISDSMEPGTRIYKNLGGTNMVLLQVLPGEIDGGFRFGDYDQDGFVDLALTGAGFGVAGISRVFKNQGGTNFVDGPSLPFQFYYGSIDWADIDNDGDLDLVHCGETSNLSFGPHIYLNENGSFVHQGQLLSASGATCQFFNANNDSYPDLLVSAHSLVSSFVYTNTGNGGFNAAGTLPILGAFTIGDVDNNGLNDVLMMGYRYNTNIGNFEYGITRLFLDAESFPFHQVANFIPNVQGAAGSWADYDGDGDLDLIMMGKGGDQNPFSRARLYRNESISNNSPPSVPPNLSAKLSGGKFKFSWDESRDANQSGGLSYNVRVGSSPGAGDIVGPMSAADGFRRVVRAGNAQYRTNCFLTGLEVGKTYYWSVQAIDNGFAGSPFAPEQSFFYGQPPEIKAADMVFALEDTQAFLLIEVQDPDSDLSNLSITAHAQNPSDILPGSITISGKNNYRMINFTPGTNITGFINLIVLAEDEIGNVATNTTSVYIVAVNDRPTALPGSMQIMEDSPSILPLAGHDPDTNQLSFSITRPPLHGAVTGLWPNILYTPETNYFGGDRVFFSCF